MTPAEAMREAAAALADDQARSDLLIAAKYPDESVKYDNRAHRCKTIATAIRALPLPAAPSESAVAAERLLAELGSHENWALEFDGRTYGDDDNPDLWTVYERSGPINDTEWSAIGRGTMPLDALAAAIRNRPALAVSDDGEKR